MGFAPEAVDDAYTACREEMLQNILAVKGILQEELKINTVFQKEWNTSSHCQKQIPGGLPLHTQALQAVGNSLSMSKKFNKAVETKGGTPSIYKDQFHFKSLHFLLMDAFRLLKNDSQCSTVYSATFEDFTAVKGTEVRFGGFIPANYDKMDEEEGCADGGTLFTINTCSIINLEELACSPEYTLRLISPVEVFKVEDVKTGDTECPREIVLTSSRFHSNHNCYLFPR